MAFVAYLQFSHQKEADDESCDPKGKPDYHKTHILSLFQFHDAYDGNGIDCPVASSIYAAARNHPLALTFVYIVSVVLSYLIAVEYSTPTFSSDIFALIPKLFVVFPSTIEPKMPMLSRPRLIFNANLDMFNFTPAEDD